MKTLESHILSKGRSTWRLAPLGLAPDESLKIDWHNVLPPGLGTKSRRGALTSSMKKFFLSAYGGVTHVGVPYGQNTLLQRHGTLKQLVRWMVQRDIWRFSDLDASDLLAFLSGLRSSKRGELLAEKTLESWLELLHRLWELRGHYPLALKFDVRKIEDEVRAQVRVRRERPWDALPDDVALAFIRDAIAWLEDYGVFIFDVAHAGWIESSKMVGRTSRQKSKARGKFYRALGQSPEFGALQDALSFEGLPHQVMSRAMLITEGACATLLLLVIGLRLSELLALDWDCGSSGSNELTYVNGPAAKKNGLVRRWVAGYPVPQVLEFMRELTRNSREMQRTPTKALFLSRPTGTAMFLPDRLARRLATDPLQKRINAFACSGLRKSAVQAERFHPHMARKTFAKMAVRRDKRNLEPVSAHFGHVYRSFTDGRYVGADHELSQLLDQQDREELASGLRHLLMSKRLAGGAALALAKSRDEARFSGKRTLEALVDELIERGVKLAPCDWGFCVYAKVHSACAGDEYGPNEAKRSPDVCAGCRNFAVSPRHRAWWEERASREEAFLGQAGLPGQTREVVERRLRKSQQILAEIVWMSAPSAASDAQTTSG